MILVFVMIVFFSDVFLNIPMSTFSSYFQLPLCIILIIFGFLPILQYANWNNTIFEYWGRYSLEIYLWHVIPIIALKYFFSNDHFIYYTISCVSIVLLFLFTFLISRKQFI